MGDLPTDEYDLDVVPCRWGDLHDALRAGYDNIDVEAARERGVVVTNTPGVLDETTAEVAFMLMLAAAPGMRSRSPATMNRPGSTRFARAIALTLTP